MMSDDAYHGQDTHAELPAIWRPSLMAGARAAFATPLRCSNARRRCRSPVAVALRSACVGDWKQALFRRQAGGAGIILSPMTVGGARFWCNAPRPTGINNRALP